MFPLIDFGPIDNERGVEIELARRRASISKAFIRVSAVQTVQEFVFERRFILGDVSAGRAEVLDDVEGIGPV